MAEPKHKVGGEVDSKCGKCKEVTGHVIIALVDEKAKRVECLSCHAVHNYRPPPKKKTAKKKAAKKKATRKKTRGVKKIPEDAPVFDYSPTTRYEVDQVLKHKKFGLGIISRVDMTRITVQFVEDKQIRLLYIKP